MLPWSIPAFSTFPVKTNDLRLFDNSKRQVLPVSVKNQLFKIYVCGITPYDATHIGHAATYLAFDLINRYELASGNKIHFVQNITDIDDPLLERANKIGENWEKLAEQEIKLFEADMTYLNIVPPNNFVAVTEVMDKIIAAIDSLLRNDYAYFVEDDFRDVYLHKEALADFGKFLQVDKATLESIFANNGGDPGRKGKKDVFDPLLWRVKREGEPSWEAPFGAGRPGWHLECALIALDNLGSNFDIQGGGQDLLFPHHEYSAGIGKILAEDDRFSRFNVNAGMIAYEGEKMSKSLGNLVFVSTFREEGVNPNIIRLALMKDHFQTEREWTKGLYKDAENRNILWSKALEESKTPAVTEVIQKIYDYLGDNLNTTQALATIDNWARKVLYPYTDPRDEFFEGETIKLKQALNSLLGLKY